MTPFKGNNRVTSPYGQRIHPITGKGDMHRGQDIVTDSGDWTVREVTGGKVLRISFDNSRGNYVDVQTEPNTFERYQHLATVAVKVGQTLKQGDTIGRAGTTGASTGVHLHFGVYRNGTAESNAINPVPWSSIPNAVGNYPGDNKLDGQPTPEPSPVKLVKVTVGPVSPGDRDRLVGLANEMQVPHTIVEV